MKDKMPEVHDAIVAADKKSQENYSGHGSALAQVYNHMILRWEIAPINTRRCLGNPRLRASIQSQGGRNVAQRNSRDSETLDVLAELGIKFTILSPFQASRMRETGGRGWRDVNGARIDPTRPYLIKLASGRTITVFFYDAPVAQAVAFEKLLEQGDRLAQRLMTPFPTGVIATNSSTSRRWRGRTGTITVMVTWRWLTPSRLLKKTNRRN